MDVLSDILSVMKLTGALYFRTALSSPSGVDLPSSENVSRFHYVHRGRCLARVDGQSKPVALVQGDLIIITHGAAHTLSDPADVQFYALDEVIKRSGFTGHGALTHGSAQASYETQLICGHFAFDERANHVLLDAFPKFMHTKYYGRVSPTWLDDTLKVISAELGTKQLGGDFIALRLSEIIFTQAVRYFVKASGAQNPGLAGFSDPYIRKALEAIHTEPAKRWSVETLARTAGLSRTAFATRYTELIADTPLSYLTAWRLQLACHKLTDTKLAIIEIFTRFGNQSEAAFGRAFKRLFDIPPATLRKHSQRDKTIQYINNNSA